MAWDFSTDPEWATQLGWVEEFVRSECEPIDLIVKESHDLNDPVRQALIPPLQKIVQERDKPAPDMFPSEHLLRLREAAEAKFADKLAGIPRS
jgi:acyl-CoA dehydrogenase